MTLVACADPTPQPTATGEVGPWQAAAPLPTPRANHCTAAIGDWVLAIGGNYMADGGFVKTDEIHAAKLDAGVLGPWQLAGRTPSPVTECTATADGTTLYVIDGLYDREDDGRKVWTAELDASGVLGPLTAMGALPSIAISSEATVHDGELLLMDTQLPAEGDATVTLRTPLDAVAWTTEDWAIGFRAQSQYAFADRFIYTLGGYVDPAVGTVADVFVAPIDGAAAARATTPLPTPTGFGEAVAVDDWLFVVGGRGQVFGAPGTTNVYAAPIGADGSLGAWEPRTALPMPRTNHEVALVGDYLVSTGGAAMGPGDANVLVAQVRWSQAQ